MRMPHMSHPSNADDSMVQIEKTEQLVSGSYDPLIFFAKWSG